MDFLVFAFVIGTILLAMWFKAKVEEAARREAQKARQERAAQLAARGTRTATTRVSGPPTRRQRTQKQAAARVGPARQALPSRVKAGRPVAEELAALERSVVKPHIEAIPSAPVRAGAAPLKAQDTLPLGFLRTELQRAIVISEILGPPRGLRPLEGP